MFDQQSRLAGLRDQNLVYFDYAVVSLAIIANTISLSAVASSRFQLEGYKRLLISLSAGDLYISIVNVLVFAYYLVLTPDIAMQYSASSLSYSSTRSHHQVGTVKEALIKCSPTILRSLKLAGFVVNLFNICAMTFDNYLGVAYPIKYRLIMSTRLARMSVVLIWLIAFAIAFLDIPLNYFMFILNSSNNAVSSRNGDTDPTKSMTSFVTSAEEGSGAVPALGLIHRPETSTESFEFESLSDFETYFDANVLATSNPSSEFSNMTNRNTSDAVSSLIEMLSKIDDGSERSTPSSNFCVSLNSARPHMWFEFCVIGLALMATAFLAACYIVIFRKVASRIDNNAAQGRSNKKLIFTTIMFLGTFMFCWLPFMIYEFAMLFALQQDEVDSDLKINKFSYEGVILTGAILNSILTCYPLLDPIIYVWRIPVVQRAVILKLISMCPTFASRFLPKGKDWPLPLDSTSSMLSRRPTNLPPS